LRESRIILIIVIILVITAAAVFAFIELVFYPTTQPQSVWRAGAQYPLQLNGVYGIAGQQCVNDTQYIYCIGGQDVNQRPRDEVYTSSPISSSSRNITSWTNDSSSYPQNINGHSCVSYSSHVYCVGGAYDTGDDDVATSYFASLGSNGQVGSWNATTSYPVPIDTQSCVASSGYIYCISGYNETDGTYADSALSSSVWYAQLSPSGIGIWRQTASYPSNLYIPTCYASEGYIYCIGALNGNKNAMNSVYYATLSSSGIGRWTETTSYPDPLTFQACAISSGNIYCVGGEGSSLGSYTDAVYYAPISSNGVGAWKKSSADYPDTVWTNCVGISGYIYCVGGFDDSSQQQSPSVYYAPLSQLRG
jgi:hypothetical protein